MHGLREVVDVDDVDVREDEVDVVTWLVRASDARRASTAVIGVMAPLGKM